MLTIGTILFTLGSIIFFTLHWVLRNYDNMTFDEIIFHLSVPLKGTEHGLIKSYMLESGIPIVLMSILESNAAGFVYTTFNHREIIKIIIFLVLLLYFILAIIDAMDEMGIFTFIKHRTKKNKFVEDNYVDPRKVKLTFPKKKKNLIYIFSESLETTYLSKDLGGNSKTNLMPEISKLAVDNINFSNTNKLGGALKLTNSNWTTAGMVTETSGLFLRLTPTKKNKSRKFLGGLYSIGEILAKEGYSNTLMIGSDAVFGARDKYFRDHGNYKIIDYPYMLKNNMLPSGYHKWWGCEDSKLFNFAKDEIVSLSKSNKPFNISLLTVNTHHIGGYVEPDNNSNYSKHYSKAIYGSDKEIAEFINWVEKQTFAKDTVIVLCGDHLSMDKKYFNDLDKNYKRTVFNLIVNSDVKPSNTHNREFCTMDLFPTTLASLGVKIVGNRLGLGTNLFSTKATLMEEVGPDKFNDEIDYSSSFYNEKIIK
jgi:phosphoglycerol transferase